MPVSELEKKPERRISAARIEKSRPSGASFKRGLNPVCKEIAYLEEKARVGQVPHVINQLRSSTSSSTNLEPKKASINSANPARVRRTAVWLRQPSW